MADTTRLSVEKALNKMREADGPKSQSDQRNQRMEELDEEIRSMREQRLRLERHHRDARKADGG